MLHPGQMREKGRGRQVVAGVLVAEAVAAAAGCASAPGPSPASTPASPSGSPPVSPPVSPSPAVSPTVVPGTQLTGAGAFEGPVRQVPVNGIRIGYRQFGAGPDLVMVIGYSSSMSLWTVDLLTGLARHFRVTIFDNRGVGYTTDDLAQPITVPLMAEDTAGLIRALGLRSPMLLGWSMGGEIGLTVAAMHPGVLSRLVTTGGNAGSPHAVQPSPAIIRVLNDPHATPGQFLDLLFPPTAGPAKQAFAQQYLLVPQQMAGPVTLRRQYDAETAFAAYLGTWDALPRIRIPVLVTNGTEDVVVPPANAVLLQQQIKNATLDMFGGAGHGMLFQDANRFVTLVSAFAG